jgi:predicted peptidase
MGGYGSWVLAAKYPAMWAAVAPICGGGNPADGPKLKDIPLWAFHGDKDTAVPLKKSEEMIEAIKAAGGNPKLTVYPGVGHNSWDKAYRDEKLWEWFLQHSKK